jgi:hypothetical protein
MPMQFRRDDIRDVESGGEDPSRELVRGGGTSRSSSSRRSSLGLEGLLPPFGTICNSEPKST